MPSLAECGQSHAVTGEDVRHFHTVGWAASGSVNCLSGLAEVCRTHDRWGDDGKLSHILAAKIVEAAHRASRDTQCLPETNLDGRAVNRPS